MRLRRPNVTFPLLGGGQVTTPPSQWEARLTGDSDVSTTPAKICQICKEDCSKKPRVKDAQGRYSCEACVAQRKAEAALLAGADPKPAPESRHPSKPGPKPATPEPIPLALDDADSPSAGFWDEAPSSAPAPAAAAPTARCGSCGAPMRGGAVVCTLCGYNSQTGKKMKIKTGVDGGVSAGSVATGAGKGVFRLGLWLLGGGIAGAIGLGIWLAIAIYANLEIGYVAVGVGALVGAGVAITGQKHLNAISGMIAAAIAFFCVAGWKIAAYLLLSAAANAAPGLAASAVEAALNAPDGDQTAMEYFVYDVAMEMEADGKQGVWPAGLENAGTDERKEAMFDEFPEAVQKEANVRWAKKTDSEKQAFKQQVIANVRAEMQAITSSSGGTSASSIFTAREILFMVLWTFLACGVAFKIGQNGFGR